MFSIFRISNFFSPSLAPTFLNQTQKSCSRTIWFGFLCLHQILFFSPDLSYRKYIVFYNFEVMKSNHFDDAHISAPMNSCGKIASQLRIPNQQPFSDLRFKRSRIPLSVNRSKLSIPYKSQLCNLFQLRKCFYGENCHFAHKLSEIRQAAGLKTVAMEKHVSERNGIWRVQECHFFSSGIICPYGDNCHFLHKCDRNFGGNESGLNRVSDKSVGDSIECRSLSGSSNSHYHKTRLCAKWERGGCWYGEKCTYAHGIEELRGVGCYAKLEKICDSRLMLDSQPSFGGPCKIGVENAMKEGGVPIMDRNIAKISEIYADWVGVGHDFSMSC